MQGNYVKLLHPQVRDLGKRDGRGSVSGSSSPQTSHRFSHHVRSPGIAAARCERTDRDTGSSPPEARCVWTASAPPTAPRWTPPLVSGGLQIDKKNPRRDQE